MMNVFAISLVLTTLVTAGVFSPNPEKKDDVIVKEGHRVVVVEYEPNDGQTKVSISSQETEHKAKTEYVSVSDVKDKLSAKAEQVEEKIKESGGFYGLNARELVCDAFGKCKHKIASVLEGAKDSVSDKVHEIEEDAKEGFEKVAGKAHEASEKASELKESVVKKVDEVRTKTVDTTNTLTRHLMKNASEDLDLIEEKLKEDAQRLKLEGKNVGRTFFSNVSAYIFSAKNFRSLMGIIHLLGFALSYGVSVWMTFVSSNILASSLPKQQFAMVQSRIYPAYFKTMSCGIGTAFLGHMLSQMLPYYANRTEAIQGLIFLAIISMTMFNSSYLEPRATKVMRERIKLEKEEGKGKDVFDVEPSTSSVDAFMDPTGIKTGKTATHEPALETQQDLSKETARLKPQVDKLSQRLKKLNAISSLLNTLTLMGLSCHLVYLSQILHSNPY